MKTCLLISGLPRHVEVGYPSILNSLMIPNNPDVFIHTWLDVEAHPDYAQKILDMYQPKKYIIEKQRTFHNSSMNLTKMLNSYACGYQTQANFSGMLYSSWYSVHQSNILKEQYRLENDINYDYVIRARFDINYSHIVDCKQYDNKIIHTSNRSDMPTEMIDDRFAFGSNALMNIYCNGFFMLDYIHSLRFAKDEIFCGETLLYEMGKLYGITYKKIDSLHCGHIR